MADETISIRAMLEDEISGHIPKIRHELEELEALIKRLNKSQITGAAASSRSITTLGSSYGNLNRSITSASSSANSFIGNLAKRTAQAGGLAAAALETFGLKSSSSIEKLQISFNTMFGPDQGKQLFSQLQQLANYTPFTTQQQTQAAQILGSYGIATKDLVGLSKAMSDVASASANPADSLNSIALALGQIQARGKVAGQEIMQLANNQVPALQLIADMYGTTTAKVQKFMDAGGQIPAAPFLKAFENLEGPLSKFKGLSDAQAKSLSGVWSTTFSLMQQDAAKTFAPISDQIKTSLASPEIAAGIHNLFADLTPGLASLTGNLIRLAPSILKIVGSIGGPILSGFASLLADSAPSITKLADKSPQFADGIGEVFTKLKPLVPDLVMFTGNMVTLATNVLPGVLGPLVSITHALAVFSDSSDDARFATGAAITAFLGWRTVSGVVSAISAVTAAVNALATAEARAAFVSKVGVVGRFGVAGAGLAAIYEGSKSKNEAVNALGIIGGGAVTGAAIGSAVLPGVGTGIGAGVGAIAAYGAKRFFGDPGGSLGHSVAMHSAVNSATSGNRQITSGLRNWGLSSSASGHANGTSLDVTGSNMASYAQNVRAAGGYASQHDNGSGMHVHTDWGDTPTPSRGGMGGSGSIYSPINMTVVVQDQFDFERAVHRVLDQRDRNIAVRS